ncbi:KH domain protein [Dictyocaulus viviparus]|uniref:KH domain protein n=1 Tax=Dictyocaulus viviparus TaxID=29172 RepID=A0A0D8Y918_DICVI|nr:KH domain protein [Dictyocaulus viviparus]
MNLINAMVKNGQFTTQLANVIFTLCAQLKTSGINLEQTHRNELNKVFVSLRQACCRDNGQLGTPCRSIRSEYEKGMPLTKAKLSGVQLIEELLFVFRLKIMELVELRAMHWRSNLAHSQYYLNRPEQQHEQVLPTQQMTFLPHSPLFVPTDTPQSPHPANASFYLIPASSGWIPPMIPGIPPNPFIPQPLIAPETVLMRQRSMKKAKTMLRHEMIIRNSDSGKIMGVKGRRVALVEQMTNTVISFQKVDPKSKERTLTITASSMEDIERAKDLIIDTIKRNMSPIRVDRIVNDKQEDEDENENDISIETTQDGMLKLCCSDPEVLQAAQEALSEYLRSRARPSAEEREKRKERRKSMPLQANQSSSSSKNNRSIHGSTPNLAETVVEAEAQQATTGNPETFKPTYCYDRTTLLKFRENTNDIVDEVRTRIADVATEILR